MKYLLFTVLITLAAISCKPSKDLQRSRAEAFYRANPMELAVKCAETFPVKDSVGAAVVDSVVTAINQNYRTLIDSLSLEAQTLSYLLDRDTTVIASWYREQINTLKNRIVSLNALYKPCQPEIIYQTKPVYKENTARVTALTLNIDQLKGDTGLKAAEIRSIKAKLEQSISEKEVLAKRARNRLFGIIGLGVVIVGGSILVIRLT